MFTFQQHKHDLAVFARISTQRTRPRWTTFYCNLTFLCDRVYSGLQADRAERKC